MSQAQEPFPYSSFRARWGWGWGQGREEFPSLPWRRHHAQQLRTRYWKECSVHGAADTGQRAWTWPQAFPLLLYPFPLH